MSPIFHKKSLWAWAVCALLLAGFLTNSLSDYWVARESMRKTLTESTLPLTSDNVYSEIQRDLLRPIFIASLMANDTFLRDWAIEGEQDQEAIVRYLHEIKIKYGTVTSFFVSDKTLKYYYAHGLLKIVSEDEPRDEWYFRVREMDEPYEINVDPDMANRDTLTIFINYRVTDYAGQFLGATGVGLTVNKVNHLISRYEAKYDRQIYFVDAGGQVVLRTADGATTAHDSLQEIDGLAGRVDELLAGKTESLTYDRAGDRRVMNCRYVPELDWFLIVEQSEAVILGPLRQQLLVNMLTALLTTAVIAAICIFVVRSQKAGVERQNRELKEQARLIRNQQAAIEAEAAELESLNAKLKALNHEKDDFLGIVAHDLRNPLNSIIGLSELTLSDLPPDSPLNESLGHIQKSGEDMLELIDELLNVARIEAYHESFQTEPVAWNPLIEQTTRRFEKEAARKHIRIHRELDATAETKLPGVQEWMEIILNNLLSNALKYSPEYGEVTIRTERGTTSVTTRIKDSGPGISPEEQTQLFQKFVRLSAKPTGNEHSTGLGLYVVKQMCDRLGIKVRVESALGRGATFILEQELSHS
ncbi:MAG TPA: sensor histidine kinase [Opitutales bacterium]|nr:sensor histidine kinase [Opitutales bacterium]